MEKKSFSWQWKDDDVVGQLENLWPRAGFSATRAMIGNAQQEKCVDTVGEGRGERRLKRWRQEMWLLILRYLKNHDIKNNHDRALSRRKYNQIKSNTVQKQLKSRNTKANAEEQAVTTEEQQYSAW